jgi:hypothetical protein
VMIVFAVTKFTSGAWFVVVLIPTLVMIFSRIHRHYRNVARNLSAGMALESTPCCPIQTIVLVDDVHAETLRTVNFARSLGHPWKAILVEVNPEKAERVRKKWETYVDGGDELVIIPSPYRQLATPIREYIEGLLDEDPNCFVHVIMGHLAMESFWEQTLHQNSAYIFNVALAGLPRVAVTQVPYQIHHIRRPEKS